MSVLFNYVPHNIRVPLWYAELNAGGTPYQAIQRLLLIGQKLSAGTATANVPILMRDGQEDGFFGLNSMLAEMYKTARKAAPFQEIWCMPIADDGAGVAASGTITVGGSAPSNPGTMTVYIAGKRVRIAVLTSDGDDDIAAKLVAEINATAGIPVTAAVNGSTAEQVDLTAKHKGALGNEIKIHTDLVGDENATMAAKLTIVQLSSGSGDPDVTSLLDGLGDEDFDWIAAPYSDTTNLGAFADLLNDASGRWSPIKQIYGHYITMKAANLAGLSSAGNARNNSHETIMGCYGSPTPPWIWAASVGGVTASHLQAPPELSRPLQTLDLPDVIAPKIADRFNTQERQVLYYDGIASYHVERDGTVSIDRLITTYQVNEWGSPDATWLDVNTIAQAVYGIRYLKQKVTNAHGRQALADANPAGLQGVTTADDVRSTIIHGYAELVFLGVFENLDLFDRDLIVERPIDDPNRLDCYLPLDHVNQLRIVAVNATSYLQRRSPVEEIIAL